MEHPSTLAIRANRRRRIQLRSAPRLKETSAILEGPAPAGFFALGFWAFANTERWRTECAPGWRVLYPGPLSGGDWNLMTRVHFLSGQCWPRTVGRLCWRTLPVPPVMVVNDCGGGGQVATVLQNSRRCHWSGQLSVGTAPAGRDRRTDPTAADSAARARRRSARGCAWRKFPSA